MNEEPNSDIKPSDMDFKQLWRNRGFQKACDIIRILLLVVVILIFIYLIINVEYIKTMEDPCAVCVEKIGATCIMLPPGTECLPIQIEKEERNIYEPT